MPDDPSIQPYTDAWLPGPDGLKFYTRTYSPSASPCAVALFVHGFAEYIASYETIHAKYAAKGIVLFAFDQRGFGYTALDAKHKSKWSRYGRSSKKQQLEDMEWWLKHITDAHPGLPAFLVGPSMGGALSLAFVTKSTSPSKGSAPLVSGVVTTSPFLRQTESVPKALQVALKVLALVLPSILLPLPADSNHYTHDEAVNEQLDKDPMCMQKGSFKLIHDMLSGGNETLQGGHQAWPPKLPVLIIHGTSDQIASYPAAKEFHDNLGAEDKTFISIEDGRHELARDPFNDIRERVVNECVDWIWKHSQGQAPKVV